MPPKKKVAPPSSAAPARKPAAKKTAVKKPRKTAPAGTAAVFEGELLARAAADFADSKKAENVVILDVRGISMVTDFLVICEGTSLPHLRAIRNEVSDRLREDHKVKPYAAHGLADSGWMLLDFG